MQLAESKEAHGSGACGVERSVKGRDLLTEVQTLGTRAPLHK